MLLRISLGDIARMSYTFTVEYRQRMLIGPDTHFLKSGETYIISLRKRKCKWAYEEDLPKTDLPDDRLKELLGLLRETTLVSDSSCEFKTIGVHPEQRGNRDYAVVGFEFISAED